MADQKDLIDWPSEPIPPTDRLYMRIHRSHITNGDLDPGAFRDQGPAMSTEWEKYSKPLEVQSRAKVPSDNGVIEMVVSDITEIEGLSVAHTPDVERRVRGHTDVKGDKKRTGVRVRLKRIARWAIKLS